MQKQRIILIVGIILAVLVVVLIKVYLDQQRRTYEEDAAQRAARLQEAQTSVLVAREEIPKGTLMSPELFEPQVVPKQYLVPQAITSMDRISGMVAVVPIAKGEQIALTKLTFPREARTGGGLAEATPVGKRAITITVDNMASVAGMARPGNYVDIIATIPVPGLSADGKQTVQAVTVPLFQNVLILAVGQQISTVALSRGESSRYNEGGQSQPVPQPQPASSLITVALSPQEANLAAFVQEQGKLRLVLRSPADSQLESVQPTSWEVLFQYLMPKDTKRKEPVTGEPEVYVEVYRGLRKDKVPLSK
ncbi:MAG: Flp pilus assembly protein CpaB [Candidatus Omnitrophota bacterium]